MPEDVTGRVDVQGMRAVSRVGVRGYRPGLDGLRGIAVAAVIVYHADFAWLPGGFLGVDLFFVLSGYLITGILLEQLTRADRIDFRSFYMGRARRLLPALGLMLVVVSAWCVLFARDAAHQVAIDLPAVLAYVTNWAYILRHTSYFAQIGRPPLFKHLWSLSVEEQFYLFWPALSLLVYRRWARRGILSVAVVGALASTAWMAIVAIRTGVPVYADPTRVYFGTDTHLMTVMSGAALACVWRPREGAALGRAAVHVIDAVGSASLIALIWILIAMNEYVPFLYRGGFLLVAVVGCLVTAAAAHPASRFGIVLGMQPLRWLGQRSYGLYLWHWPIFMLSRPGIDVHAPFTAVVICQVALTCAIAELSYRYVEMPVRRGAIGRLIASWRARTPAERAGLASRLASAAVAMTVLVVAIIVGLVRAPAPSAAASGLPIVPIISQTTVLPGQPWPLLPTRGHINDGTVTVPVELPTFHGQVTAVGDSVLLGASYVLHSRIKGLIVDAVVGRQAYSILPELRYLERIGRLAPDVVIHTGTNGVVTTSELNQILTFLRDRSRVVLVTVHVPRTWVDYDNNVIHAVVPHYPNAVIADWAAVSAGHPRYFVSDGVHLTVVGMVAYSNMIRDALSLG